MLEDLKSYKKVVGIKQSQKALENNTVKTVIIAKDTEEKVLRSIKELCQKYSVEIRYADSMKELGKACGIEVGAAVACLLK